MDTSYSSEAIYSRVKKRFDNRDQSIGQTTFSKSDWARTRLAYELFRNSERVIDFGIGQGQLINLFCETPNVELVIGVDRAKHTKLLPPASEKFDFRTFDITSPFPAPLPQSDVAIAMEIFEHINVDKVIEAVDRTRRTSRLGMLFASVPYQEKYPLYHQEKPHGHKQSFNDETVAEVFGADAIWTNFQDRWYLVFSSNGSQIAGRITLEKFTDIVASRFRRAISR